MYIGHHCLNNGSTETLNPCTSVARIKASYTMVVRFPYVSEALRTAESYNSSCWDTHWLIGSKHFSLPLLFQKPLALQNPIILVAGIHIS